MEPLPPREPHIIVNLEISEEQAVEQAAEELDPEGPMLTHPVFYSEPSGTPEVLYNRSFEFYFLFHFIKMYRSLFLFLFAERRTGT